MITNYLKIQLDQIRANIEFLSTVWDDQKAMQDTINTEHENFISRESEEYFAYKMHEENMMRVEMIQKQLYEYKKLLLDKYQKQIPFG